MEGSSLPPGNPMQVTPYGSLNGHGNSMQMHAPCSGKQPFNQSLMLGSFAMPVNRIQDPDRLPRFQFGEHGKVDHHQHSHRSKNCLSDEEEHDMTEDVGGKGKNGSAWHRVKWAGSMVKLLITAVSYTAEDPGPDLNCGKRSGTIAQKKGKWKAISKVMCERGCNVSPQQCEDKFNDLNKRYKRLTDILGCGIACDVVGNPALLDGMDNLSDKMKEDARKILSSKHLFYEEMCSYHNNNRVSLPEDLELQHSLQLALRCKEDRGPRKDTSGEDQSADSDYEENDEWHQVVRTNMNKRMCHTVDHVDVGFVPSSSNNDSGRFDPHGITLDINKGLPDGTNLPSLQKDLASQALELQERRLQIEVNELAITKRRLKWERFKKQTEREMKRMELENERMMIMNKRSQLLLRHKELELMAKGDPNHA